MRSCTLCLLLVMLTSCSSATNPAEGSTPASETPDADAITLMAEGEQAMRIAQKESLQVVLRQIDTDLRITDFRFVDSSMTEEIMVIVPGPNAPTEKWSTVVNTVSPLLGNAEPALELQNLIVGPRRVAQAITAHWPGCTIRGMNLHGEGGKLIWTAFCDRTEGVASGSMDGQTGIFQPSDSPRAPLPLTATPVP